MYSAAPGARAAAVPFHFSDLPAYTAEEVVLWNWFQRVFPGGTDWRRRLREVCGSLLTRPKQEPARLLQTNSVESGQEPKRHVLEKGEILLGRGPENDVVLPAKAIGKTHARIVRSENAYYLEDLGSPFGTHLSGRRLEPDQPEALRDGAHFTIFPYQFEFESRAVWIPEDRVELLFSPVSTESWGTFATRAESGCALFPVFIHPMGGWLALEFTRTFLMEVVQRLLSPLRLDARRGAMLPSDSQVLEFAVLSALDAANRDLRFPFQFELGSDRSRPERPASVRGLALSAAIGLSGLTGAVRVFLPYDLLREMAKTVPAIAGDACAGVSWRFPVSAGYVDLSARDLARLETGDVVIFSAKASLLYPNAGDHSWTGSLQEGNTWSLRLDKYVERSAWMAEIGETEQTAAPNLDDLPLRVQVILGEKELTLAEANRLAPDTILALGFGKTDPVRLAINGKPVGRGELVEIDGRLGVRISEWS